MVAREMEMAAVKRADAKRRRQIQQGNIDESEIPAWARMTPEEKAARNGRG